MAGILVAFEDMIDSLNQYIELIKEISTCFYYDESADKTYFDESKIYTLSRNGMELDRVIVRILRSSLLIISKISTILEDSYQHLEVV